MGLLPRGMMQLHQDITERGVHSTVKPLNLLNRTVKDGSMLT